MHKNPSPKPTSADRPKIVDEGPAPIVFFDEAPNFGNNDAIVNVTLCAYRNIAQQDGSIYTDLLVTAHLRCSIGGAAALRKALDDALLLGAPTGVAN